MNGNFQDGESGRSSYPGVQNAGVQERVIALCMTNILNTAVFIGKLSGIVDARFNHSLSGCHQAVLFSYYKYALSVRGEL